MAHPKAALLWLVACFFSLVAVAEPKGAVTVFPFDFSSARIDRGSQVALEEGVRSIVADTLAPQGYNVLTGDTQLRLMQDNGVDPSKVCDANCSLSAAREIKAAFFITGICSSSEGQYICFVRLFRAKDGRQLASVDLDGSTVREVREKLKTQAGALLAELAPAATVAESSAAPSVPVVAALASVRSGHELRLPDPGASAIVECDQKFIKAFRDFGLDQQLVLNGVMDRTAMLKAVDDDRARASGLAVCAGRFGPMYSYPPAVREGETPKRSALETPLHQRYPNPERCADLKARVGEIRTVAAAHKDDLDTSQWRLYFNLARTYQAMPLGCQIGY